MRPLAIIISSDRLGTGDDEIGEVLIQNFLKGLLRPSEKPASLFLVNRGVMLARESSPASEFLGELQEEGVEILLCQTCVNYYDIGKEVAVGQISGMDRMIELMMTCRTIFL